MSNYNIFRTSSKSSKLCFSSNKGKKRQKTYSGKFHHCM